MLMGMLDSQPDIAVKDDWKVSSGAQIHLLASLGDGVTPESLSLLLSCVLEGLRISDLNVAKLGNSPNNLSNHYKKHNVEQKINSSRFGKVCSFGFLSIWVWVLSCTIVMWEFLVLSYVIFMYEFCLVIPKKLSVYAQYYLDSTL